MSDKDSGIILHNYPQSPVAEKIRVAFGIKGLSWGNVEIPRLPPKPMLTTLTGGYRRTPVMQIGADIYCDTLCIIQELEKRFPSPSFMPTNDAGLLWCLSRWTDGSLFDLGVKIVLGSAGENLPADFAEDRGRLYLGENWAEGLKNANAELPHLLAQFRTSLSWLNQQLSDGRKFLTGQQPAAIDAQMYHVAWFINGRWEGGPALIAQFPHVQTWMESVDAIGHGQPTAMTPEKALETATSAQTQTREGVADNDPQGLTLGQRVSVVPDVNGGEQAVEGTIRMADIESVAVNRISDIAGEVCVHFPRAGYRIEIL